eukprot:Gb_22303 [translate_table: standard]
MYPLHFVLFVEHHSEIHLPSLVVIHFAKLAMQLDDLMDLRPLGVAPKQPVQDTL